MANGRSCVFKNFYHLVFVTKYRRHVFTIAMLERLNQIFLETCSQVVPTKLSMANLIGKLKGKSSYIIRKEFWDKIKTKLWGQHLWSPSYCCVTCGGAPLDIVKKIH